MPRYKQPRKRKTAKKKSPSPASLVADEPQENDDRDDSDDSSVRERLLPPGGEPTAERFVKKRRIPEEELDFIYQSEASSSLVKSDDEKDEDFVGSKDKDEEDSDCAGSDDEEEEEEEYVSSSRRRGRSRASAASSKKVRSSTRQKRTQSTTARAKIRNPKVAPKRAPAARRSSPRKSTSQSKAEDDDSDAFEDSNDDSEAKPKPGRKRRTGPKKKQDSESESSSSSEEYQLDDDGENDEDDDSESSSDGEPKTPPKKTPQQNRKKKGTKQPKQTKSATRRSSRLKANNEESKDDDGSLAIPEQTASGRAQRSSARKATQVFAKQLDELGSDEDDEVASPKRSKRQSSDDEFSASDEAGDDDVLSDVEEEEEEYNPRSRGRATRRRQKPDDLGDFLADSEEEQEISLPDDDDESDVKPKTSRSKRSVNIDKEDIGENEASASSEDEKRSTIHKLASHAFREISTSQKEAKKDNRDSREDENKDNTQLSRAKNCNWEDCPSDRDPITDDVLPRRHVCFITADGSRQCFALSTLHNIATTASLKRYRVDNTGETKQTFLQPPHFRSEMSDDLLDQIASRFGREALNLDGLFYKELLFDIENPDRVNGENEEGSPDMQPARQLSSQLADNEEFLAKVQQYVKAQMGNQDLYVCPLCFSVAQARFRSKTPFNKSRTKESDEDDEEKLRDKYLLERHLEDPIATLKSLDRNHAREMEIASTFCRTRASEIKEHIREIHGLDTKNIESNVLYARYKVRDQDGLLQRYLRNNNRGTQGDMQRYWFQGNNFDFVHLLCLVERAKLLSMVDAAGDDEVESHEREEAQEYFVAALQFFKSFRNIVRALWELISAPHQKSNGGEDLDGFLAGENDGDDDGDENEPVSHRALDMENIRKAQEDEAHEDRLIVEQYKTRAEKLEAEDGDESVENSSDVLVDSDNSSDVLVDSDSESSVGDPGSDDDEHDEWEQSILAKRRVRSPKDKKKPARRNPRDRLSKGSILDSNEASGLSTSKPKKRRILEEDDNGDGDASSPKRRRILEEDDNGDGDALEPNGPKICEEDDNGERNPLEPKRPKICEEDDNGESNALEPKRPKVSEEGDSGEHNASELKTQKICEEDDNGERIALEEEDDDCSV